jgi:DNA-binding NtrC family response regulator
MAESLLESELFGHEKGAFSGAETTKPGLLESARGGTVLLDEIVECSARAQAKLLRVLETKRARRLGAIDEVDVDARILASTNVALEDAVRDGAFRKDLYYRLYAANVVVPALRDRPQDIPALIRSFINDACERLGRVPCAMAPEAMELLMRHKWPGNVRELKNVVENALALNDKPLLTVAELPAAVRSSVEPWRAADERQRPEEVEGDTNEYPVVPQARVFRKLADEVRELEKRRIIEALQQTGGVRVRAAELIGMPLRTFVTKLKQYGIGRDSEGQSGPATS